MSTIPTSVTEEQFEENIRPYLKVAQRGYVCKIGLYKVFNYILKRLHTGCQWAKIAIEADAEAPGKQEISWQAVYYHWQKWNAAGCFEQVWAHSIEVLGDEVDCHHLNLDGTHTLAKKVDKVLPIKVASGLKPAIFYPSRMRMALLWQVQGSCQVIAMMPLN